MNTKEIQTMLDQLADLRAASDAIALQKQAVIDGILTEVDAEFADKAASVTERAAALEAEVKAAVLAQGESVKGTFLQAVWMKGRVSWDTKRLDGYAVAHPEMSAFRKEGEPTVSLRGMK